MQTDCEWCVASGDSTLHHATRTNELSGLSIGLDNASQGGPDAARVRVAQPQKAARQRRPAEAGTSPSLLSAGPVPTGPPHPTAGPGATQASRLASRGFPVTIPSPSILN